MKADYGKQQQEHQSRTAAQHLKRLSFARKYADASQRAKYEGNLEGTWDTSLDDCP